MAKQDINIGAFPDDKSPGVDVVRSAFQKAKENFDELYARGQGDMLKSTYDSDNSGVVDSAEKIEGVEGEGTRFYGTKDGVPGFFDLVIEATNIVFYTDAQPRPLEGVQNVVYIDKTNKTVSIWDGANYQQVAGGTVTAQAIEDALGYLPVNYTHPATHAPSIITQDANNRFVTDAEKTTWNGKQDALGFTPANDSEVVKSVTGSAVDNTDPKNPVVNLPEAAGVQDVRDSNGESLVDEEGVARIPESTDFTTDESLYIDPATSELRANVSTYSQTLTKAGSQVFTLDFEPTNFLMVHGKTPLFPEHYIFTSPTTFEIIPEMAEGEKVRVVYERFIEQP